MIMAYTSNELRKVEHEKSSNKGVEILKLVPNELIQGNESQISLVADDGNIVSIYFSIKCIDGMVPQFDDLQYKADSGDVELVSLKYVKATNEHYYKYYTRFNPLGIKMDNIVSTGFTSNDDSKVTVYITPSIAPVEEDNQRFFEEDFKGITIDIATGDTIMETDYEPTPPEGSQG